jgi:hypothetical protein
MTWWYLVVLEQAQQTLGALTCEAGVMAAVNGDHGDEFFLAETGLVVRGRGSGTLLSCNRCWVWTSWCGGGS